MVLPFIAGVSRKHAAPVTVIRPGWDGVLFGAKDVFTETVVT
jgi:hypothetical protein